MTGRCTIHSGGPLETVQPEPALQTSCNRTDLYRYQHTHTHTPTKFRKFVDYIYVRQGRSPPNGYRNERLLCSLQQSTASISRWRGRLPARCCPVGGRRHAALQVVRGRMATTLPKEGKKRKQLLRGSSHQPRHPRSPVHASAHAGDPLCWGMLTSPSPNPPHTTIS